MTSEQEVQEFIERIEALYVDPGEETEEQKKSRKALQILMADTRCCLRSMQLTLQRLHQEILEIERTISAQQARLVQCKGHQEQMKYFMGRWATSGLQKLQGAS